MRNDYESNYLAHHGILGQKWGHQNGPPYPLDKDKHSASEKKAGWIKSLKAKSEAKKKAKQRKANLEKARAARAKKVEEKKRAEEFAKEKEQILRSGNAETILKYKDKLTDQEIQSALNRIRNENEMQKFVAAKEKSGFEKIDKVMNKAGKVMDWASVGMSAYNMTADIYNTFLADNESTKWKKIPGRDWQRK